MLPVYCGQMQLTEELMESVECAASSGLHCAGLHCNSQSNGAGGSAEEGALDDGALDTGAVVGWCSGAVVRSCGGALVRWCSSAVVQVQCSPCRCSGASAVAQWVNAALGLGRLSIIVTR